MTRSTNSKVGAQAFEFWTTLAENEMERKAAGTCKNYIELCKDHLITMVL